MALQKILRTGVRKVRGNMAFLCDLANSWDASASVGSSLSGCKEIQFLRLLFRLAITMM